MDGQTNRRTGRNRLNSFRAVAATPPLPPALVYLQSATRRHPLSAVPYYFQSAITTYTSPLGRRGRRSGWAQEDFSGFPLILGGETQKCISLEAKLKNSEKWIDADVGPQGYKILETGRLIAGDQRQIWSLRKHRWLALTNSPHSVPGPIFCGVQSTDKAPDGCRADTQTNRRTGAKNGKWSPENAPLETKSIQKGVAAGPTHPHPWSRGSMACFRYAVPREVHYATP